MAEHITDLFIDQSNFNFIFHLDQYKNLINLEFTDIKFPKSFQFPQLSEGLKYLKITNCSLDYIRAKIPKTLESFICISSHLKKIPKLPEGIREVIITENDIEYIPKLPESIIELNLSMNPIKNIHSFPSNLLELTITHTKIKKFPKYPDTIIKLDISHNQMYVSKLLANLPPNLTFLDISNNNLEYIYNLPDSIECLCMDNNFIRKISRLPSKLEEFVCNNNCLYDLPYIPDSVSHLEINNNYIKNMVNFPLNLKHFHCKNNNLPEYIIIYLINNKNRLKNDGFLGANTLLNIRKSKEILKIIKAELMYKRNRICMHPNRVARLLNNGEISFDGDDDRMQYL